MTAKKKPLSANKEFLSVYGVADMIEKMERVLGEVKVPLTRAYLAAVKPGADEARWYMFEHWQTGDTWRSFNEGELIWKNDSYASFRFGFDINKGGLPALFHEYGTPRMTPTFFMYYALRNNQPKMEARMRAELEAILRERGLA